MPSRFRSCLRPAPLALATALALVAWPVQAQPAGAATAAVDLRIPRQPLAQALDALARQARLELMVEPSLVASKTAPAVEGRLTAREALRRLLNGSGLVAEIDGTAIVVKREPQGDVSTLPTVTVSGGIDRRGTTEGSGSYTSPSITTGTGLALSLRDTPQSVSVFTRQKIDDLGLQSIEDMAQQTTGLTVTRGAPERAAFISRGFDIGTLIIDGVPMAMDSDFYGYNTLAMYDHVEVLRGAAGLTVGSGYPSGVISLSRKRPGKEGKVSISGSVGSWDHYRGEIDAGGPLNEAGTLRGRAVLARDDSQSFTSNYSHQRTLFYGTVEADLTASTVLSLGASYNDEVNQGSPWYGLPTAVDGSFLPISRSANYTPSWAYWNKRNKRVFGELEHKFDNGWKAKLSTYAMNTDLRAALTSTSHVDGTDDLTVGWAGTSEYTQQHRGVQLVADGPYELLGRRHEAIFGATWRKAKLDVGGRTTDYSFTYEQTQWQALVNAPLPVYDGTWGRTLEQQQQSGVYGATRLNLADSLKLLLGSRVDQYQSKSDDTVLYEVKHKVTPYAGLVYDLDETYSLYGSWTRIFNPQTYRSRAGGVLKPLEGTNLEAGIKGELFGGALNTSAAVFLIHQKNLPMRLDLAQCNPGLSSCYAEAGKVESKGVELEASGEVARGWQLGAGYTYNIARHVETSDEAVAGTRYRSEQPTHLLKASTTYRLPGAFNAWRLGASARLQNGVFRDDGNVRLRQSGYTVVDLMAAWQATPRLDLRLNVYNLFDKWYYESVGGTTSGNGFGAPRNLQLSARYQF